MRIIKKIHKAVFEPIASLLTYRALPTQSINYMDPFLFLNHHGPQVYPANNHGLPFGPHPHRGFETVTFVLDGDVHHQDSGGNQGTIYPGGVQWMTAGSGLIHSEVSSEKFKRTGGKLEILQLWLNLPSRLKMSKPGYTDLQKQDIPVHSLDEGKALVNVIAGEWRGTEGAYRPLIDVNLFTIELKKDGSFRHTVPANRAIFFYVVRGELSVNETIAEVFDLVEFENEGSELVVTALSDAYLLLADAVPFNEPVVSHGPFVMNTEEEIDQAMIDYRSGKMGSWNK